MKKFTIAIYTFLIAFSSFAQVNNNSELYKTILTKDSLLFDVGFNTCNILQFESLLSENFDFFHDKSGISDKKKFLNDLKKGICGSPNTYQGRRELLDGSTKIYALNNNGVLYGAIQEGTHQFFENQKGNTEKFGSSAKFTHVWILENGEWKLTKSLSFEHQVKQLSNTNMEVVNRKLEKINDGDKLVFHLDEKEELGIAWFKDMEFSEGTIEFDAKGRDLQQRSFIGLAFHGIDNEIYETVYFRPFNFQAIDSIRHIHAIQYSFEPQFNFKKLRETRKDEFEAKIKPSNIQATEWFHVKIEVIGQSIKVFVNNHSEPTLNVISLNTNPIGRKIGFWVGANSDGQFANLKISNR